MKTIDYEAPFQFFKSVAAEVDAAAIGGDLAEARRRIARARRQWGADARYPGAVFVGVSFLMVETIALIRVGRISEAAVLWSRVVAELGDHGGYVDDVMKSLLDAERRLIGISG